MNLLTPLAGFLIGYGGIMGYQVIDSTYKGEMPGPKSFGYFIGGMTLLSAATIYALGRTDKVFNAEGDSCQNCESPSTQTTSIVNKYGEEHEYKFCGDGCEGQYMRENKMSYEAQGLSQFTPNELTQSSAIHGDFDHASLNYSGHQNMILKAERMHGDDRLDRWVENNYGEEYDWVLLDENAVYGDVYEELEDFIVLDDEGSEHKGIAIVYRDEDFDAEGNYNDFIEDMEGVMDKYGEMKDFDSGYNPQDKLLKARMVVEVDDEDFDNVDFDAEEVPITDWANYPGELPEQYPHRRPRKSGRGTEPIAGPDRRAYGQEKKRRLKARSPTLTVTKVEPNKKIPTMNDITFENGLVAGYPKTKDAKVGDRFVVATFDGRFPTIMDAETMMPEKQCVICGGPYTGYGHNPEPIFPMSRGRCCDVCNATVVIPYRLGGMNFRFGEDFEAQGRDVLGRFVKMDCDLCGGTDEVGYVDGEREFKVCEHCDIDGDDYNPKLWEAETVRKFRNRFDKTSPRGNRRGRAATGVKRNIWKNFFRKDAENMSDELDMVMAQLYEIEDMKNPTPEDLTNYQNLLTRYYGMVRFNAEQKTARVKTMSGKPVSETLRKLKQDKNLSAKDARTRKEIRAENMEVFEAVSSNHDTYMKILSQVIKNHESYSASKDAYLINRYGLATMKRFMKWADNIGYSTYWCFTDAARDWIEGDEISYRDDDEGKYMKDIKTLLRDLKDEKAKYQLATLIAKENSDLARIYNWTTDYQHKDVISLDNWDKNQFVLDFLATDEEQESYYSQERLTLGSKNVSMILNLGGYEDEDDEATFFDEVSPKSGKIPRNLPNTASLLDYLENNAEQFEDMLRHNDGLNYLKQLRDLYGWSFAIHPAQKYIYEEDDEIYIEWQLKRAIPAKKRQQLKLDAQKQIREFRARLLAFR